MNKWKVLERLIYTSFILTSGQLILHSRLVLFTHWLDFDHWSAQLSRCLVHMCVCVILNAETTVMNLSVCRESLKLHQNVSFFFRTCFILFNTHTENNQ